MTIMEALQDVVAERGKEILLDSRLLKAIIVDYGVDRNDEDYKLFGIAIQNGVCKDVYQMTKVLNLEELNILKKQVVHRIQSDAFLPKDYAIRAINVIAQCVGLSIFEKNEKNSNVQEKNDVSDQWEQYNIGFSYEFGTESEINYEKAVYWYNKSAEQGNSWAMNRLGDCYSEGKGINKDEHLAFEWYKKGAEYGDHTAQLNLGYCYYAGKGISNNYREAVNMFQKAADQNNVSAMKWLAYCYENGIGVDKNIEIANYWGKKAEKLSNDS